jgi:hypothetical protein
MTFFCVYVEEATSLRIDKTNSRNGARATFSRDNHSIVNATPIKSLELTRTYLVSWVRRLIISQRVRNTCVNVTSAIIDNCHARWYNVSTFVRLKIMRVRETNKSIALGASPRGGLNSGFTSDLVPIALPCPPFPLLRTSPEIAVSSKESLDERSIES